MKILYNKAGGWNINKKECLIIYELIVWPLYLLISYNYLTKNALTTTATIQSFAFNNAATATPGNIELHVSLAKPVLCPNPSTGNINIIYDYRNTGKTQWP